MKILIGLLPLFLFFNLNAQLPDYSLLDIKNSYQEINNLAGEELTIIDFWATWCKPCLIAIPELISLKEDYSDEGLNIIGVSIDSPRNQSKIQPFAMSRGINYPILLDPDQELMSALNVVVVPTLLIFNKQGEIVFLHEGFKPGDELMIRDEIAVLLKN